MAERKTILTYDGLKKLENELQDLKTNRRKDVAEKIKEARMQGDLSENAEYVAAKEEQAEIEARIVVLEKMLRNADVIDVEELDKDSISVGSRVRVLDIEFDEELEYEIVGSAEANPAEQKVSNESPLGLGLLGHHVDESIFVDAPDGVIEYKILEIK